MTTTGYKYIYQVSSNPSVPLVQIRRFYNVARYNTVELLIYRTIGFLEIEYKDLIPDGDTRHYYLTAQSPAHSTFIPLSHLQNRIQALIISDYIEIPIPIAMIDSPDFSLPLFEDPKPTQTENPEDEIYKLDEHLE